MSEWVEMKVSTEDVREGDFIDRTYAVDFNGVRGGRYREPAYRVSSAVVEVRFREARGIRYLEAVTASSRVRLFPGQRVDIRRQSAVV